MLRLYLVRPVVSEPSAQKSRPAKVIELGMRRLRHAEPRLEQRPPERPDAA